MPRPVIPKEEHGPCDKYCSRRCAEPNCHNVETCPDWAKFIKEKAEKRAVKIPGLEALRYSRARGRELHELHRRKER